MADIKLNIGNDASIKPLLTDLTKALDYANKIKMALGDTVILKDPAKMAKQINDLEKLRSAIEKKNKAQQEELGILGSLERKTKDLKSAMKSAMSPEDIKKINKELENTKAKMELAKGSTNTWGKALGSFQFKFNALGNAAGALSAGMAGVATMVGGQVLKSFGAFFTKSEAGFELMQKKTAGFNAALGVLSGEMIKLGKAVTENGVEKGIEWGEVTAKTLRLLSGIAIVLPSVRAKITDLGARMDDASTAGEKFAQTLEQIEDAEIAMIVPRAEANLKIKEAMLLYNDESLSLEERIGYLQKALDLENETADTEIKHQKVVVQNLKDQKVEMQKNSLWMDANEKALQEAIAREIDLRTASVGRQRRVDKQLASARKELTKEVIAQVKTATEFETQVHQDATDKRFALLMDSKAKELEVGIQTNEDIINSNIESGLDDIANSKSVSDKKIEIAEAEAERLKDYDKELKESKIKNAQMYLESASEALNTISSLFEANKQKELSAVGDNEKKREEIEAKYRKKQQAMSISQAIINGALSITNLLANVPGSVINPATWVAMAISAASTAAQVGIIATQKFAEGGEIDGRPHSQGGVHIEAEGGEYVINKKSTDKYKQLIEAINNDDKSKIFSALNMELNQKQFKVQSSSKIDYTQKMYELLAGQENGYETNEYFVIQKGNTKMLIPKK